MVLMAQLTQPNGNIWTKLSISFATPYWSLSIALNIILTSLIVSKILWMRRSVSQSLGSQHSKQYTSIVAMLIESAAMYSIAGLVYIICYGINSSAQQIFITILGEAQVRFNVLYALGLVTNHVL